MREQRHTFWMTILNKITIEKCAKTEEPEKEMKERMGQIEERDLQKMNELQVEKQFFNFYGMKNFKNYINKFVLLNVQSALPEIRRTMQQDVKNLNEKINRQKKKNYF